MQPTKTAPLRTVGELVDALLKLPREAELVTTHDNGYETGDGSVVVSTGVVDKSRIAFVQIEVGDHTDCS